MEMKPKVGRPTVFTPPEELNMHTFFDGLLVYADTPYKGSLFFGYPV